MIEIPPSIQIPDDELSWSYARSGGPGGQNVNKVSSKAVLRWNMLASPGVPEAVKERLRTTFPSRVTTEGEVVMSSQEYRDQERNREACVEKLVDMLRIASIKPKVRRPTKPSKGSQRRRLADKKRRSDTVDRRKSSEGD